MSCERLLSIFTPPSISYYFFKKEIRRSVKATLLSTVIYIHVQALGDIVNHLDLPQTIHFGASFDIISGTILFLINIGQKLFRYRIAIIIIVDSGCSIIVTITVVGDDGGALSSMR